MNIFYHPLPLSPLCLSSSSMFPKMIQFIVGKSALDFYQTSTEGIFTGLVVVVCIFCIEYLYYKWNWLCFFLMQSKCNGLSFGCFFINCTVQSISNAFYCIFKEFFVSNVHVTFVQYTNVICLQSAQYSIVYMYYSRIGTVCIYVVRP